MIYKDFGPRNNIVRCLLQTNIRDSELSSVKQCSFFPRANVTVRRLRQSSHSSPPLSLRSYAPDVYQCLQSPHERDDGWKNEATFLSRRSVETNVVSDRFAIMFVHLLCDSLSWVLPTATVLCVLPLVRTESLPSSLSKFSLPCRPCWISFHTSNVRVGCPHGVFRATCVELSQTSTRPVPATAMFLTFAGTPTRVLIVLRDQVLLLPSYKYWICS